MHQDTATGPDTTLMKITGVDFSTFLTKSRLMTLSPCYKVFRLITFTFITTTFDDSIIDTCIR